MGLKDQLSRTHATLMHLIDGMEQGVSASHPPQALFEPRLAADALDVAVHHDRSVLKLGPAQGQT